MSVTPGARVGPYEITGAVGAGGMGEVFRARDTKLNRDVAIKVLPAAFADDPERLARFKREAQILASLNHTNIAAIHGLEEDVSTGTVALAMEYVEGEDLAQRLARGPIPLDDSVAIARQIAEGLEEAHEHGIIHRDLKPANVKVTSEGKVKILDFGLAKAMEGDMASGVASQLSNSPTMSRQMTEAGVIMGTAAYMSPEQAKGRPVDRRADIWAFGVVLFEMLSGRRLFAGESVSDTLASVIKDAVNWDLLPSEVPVAVRRLLRRCLEKDPRRRLSAIGDARLDLDEIGNEAEVTLPTAATRGPESSAVLPWVIAGLAVLIAAGLALNAGRGATRPPAVIRTMIAQPENVAFNFDNAGPPALSPDGTMVAFAARAVDGITRLYIQSLDAIEARPLPGTEGATFPFWAPDSQSLGFGRANSAGSRIERVDLAGGAPVVIMNAGFVRGASWTAGDRVLYDTSDNGGSIMVVPISGGEAKVLVKGSPKSPWMLPDGRHFLYVARPSVGSGRIHVASIDGSSDVELADAHSNAMYASSRLLFQREDTLLAQPFDLTALKLTGAPVPVARGVQRLLGEPPAMFSASENGFLLYQDGASESATRLAWFDRNGKQVEAIGEMGNARGVRLSPDGQAVSLSITSPEGRGDLWTIDLRTRARRQLTFARAPGEVSSSAVWARDGRSILYSIRQQGLTAFARSAVSGGSETAVKAVPPDKVQFDALSVTDWSAENRSLLFHGTGAKGVWTAPLDPGSNVAGQAAALVTDLGSAQNARLSPNERWFAYQGNPTGTGATASGIFVEAFPGGGRRQQVTPRGGIPVWGPDGKTLYFAAGFTLFAVGVTEADGTLQFGEPRAVMPVMSARGFSYDVAKDGRILALVTNEARAARPLTLVQNWTLGLKE